MALLKFKRSATPSKVPTTSDLSLGELAMNTFDGKLYMKKDDGTQAIVEIGAASGGGTWGSITGTLSNQTDLWNALSAKQDSATALTTTTSFGGDVSGTYDNIIVADDSHNHIIANVDGLQTALDGKLNLTGGTLTNKLTIQRASFDVLQLNRTNSDNNVNIEFVGTSNTGYLGKVGTDLYWGVNADLNNLGYKIFHDNYHPNADKLTTARTISLTGDVSGSTSFDGSANVSISAVVADDSHNHIIANVDGLQTALDGKLSTTGKAADSNLLDGIDSTQFLRSDTADTATGRLTFDGGIEVRSGTGGGKFRIKRNTGSTDGDDITDIHMDDSGTFFDIDNDNDGDAGIFRFRKKSGGSWVAPDLYAGSDKIFNDGYAPFDGLTSKTSGTGTYQTSGSFRAPIFYDSDNTGYFLDPSSGGTSLNVAGSVGIGRSPSTDKLEVAGSVKLTNLGAGQGLIGYNTSSQHWEIASTSATSSGVRFDVQGNQRLSINSAGNVTAAVDLRAPIFYDSNNTGFNLNANGSAWQLQTPTGYLRAGPMNTGYCHFNTDRARYYFDKEVQFDGGINDYSGNWRFNDSLGQHDVSLRAPHFYDSNNTAYYANPASTSVLNGLSVGGYTVNPITSAWYTTSTYVYDPTNGTRYYYIKLGTMTSSGGAIIEYVAKDDINYPAGVRGQIFAGRYASNSTSIQHDTHGPDPFGVQVYLDNSNQVWLRVPNCDWSHHLTWRFIWVSNFAITSDGTKQETQPANSYLINAGQALRFGDSAAASGPTQTYSYDQYTNRLYARADFRAPIYYDSDNTAYYVDPASGSYVSGEFGVKQSGTNGFRIYSPTGTQSLWVRAGYDTNGTATPVSSPTNIQFQSSGSSGGSFTFVSGNTKALTVSGDYAQGAGSLRAPIFYDSNNTGYWVDPAATGKSAHLRSYVEFADFGAGIVGKYSSTRYQLVFAMGTAYKGALDGTNVTGGYGLWYSHPNAGGVAANLNNHGLMNIVNGAWHASLASSTRAVTDMRAPIFYDLNNSGYYTDPASTSQLNALTLAGNLTVNNGNIYGPTYINMRYGASGAGGVRLYDNQGTVQGYWYGDGAGEHGFLDNNGHWAVRIRTGTNPLILHCDNNPELYVYNSYVVAAGSMRAPIFYDSNNTAYYADLSSTADSIRAAGDIVAYYSDDRLKDRGNNIANALDKVQSLNGFHYTANETAQKFGYKAHPQVGVSAQEVEAILPEVVKDAAIGHGYKTVDYAKLVPLLIEAIKELKAEVETLKKG